MRIDQNYGYIYIIENDINNKLYVGRTLDLKKRERVHFSKSSRTWGIKSAVEKYGGDHFDFIVLESCASEEELNNREAYWIRELNTLSPFGYNLKEGGKSGKPTKEVRRKLSQAHKGVKLSDAHKRAIGQAGKGRVFSEETRRKISESHKGLTHSEESKRKMSEAKRGRKLSEETNLKMSIAHKGKPQPVRSKETCKKISEALTGRKLSLEHRQKISQALRGNKNGAK